MESLKQVDISQDVREQDINNYFKALTCYCDGLKKEEFVFSRRLLSVNKQDLIIFPVNMKDIESVASSSRKAVFPLDRIFIEIPSWSYENDEFLLNNLGGILLVKENLGGRIMFTASTFWMELDKVNGGFVMKPLSVGFFDTILFSEKQQFKEEDIFRMGSQWKDKCVFVDDKPVALLQSRTNLSDEIKCSLANVVRKICLCILDKVEKKEYPSYKKWTPSGCETKEIVYSKEVMSHKRHFWKDSGRFKIPYLSQEELKSKGYGIDELVYRDGELRRDVPFRIINSFVLGKEKPKQSNNRIVNLFDRKILKQEQKIYVILKKIYPEKIIRKHDRIALKGLELDFNLPELRLGIEYDGEQHFDKELYEKIYGNGFEEQVKRDRLKEKLCEKKGIKLIRIKFDEPITKSNLSRLICR